MIAKAHRRAISSVSLLVNPFWLLSVCRAANLSLAEDMRGERRSANRRPDPVRLVSLILAYRRLALQ